MREQEAARMNRCDPEERAGSHLHPMGQQGRT
jgi:hypothetical protein